MRRGVLGGSFDPVHNGHLRLAVEAKESLQLDLVVLEVAAISPFKTDRQLTDAEARYDMVCSAVEGTQGLVPGRTELSRPSPSYAVDTLAAYSSLGDELWFIIGADSLSDFPAWCDPDRILQLARLAVASRPAISIESALAQLPPRWRERIDVFDAPLLDISSTDIRRRVTAGLSIRHLTPDSVVQTIEEGRLYS